MTTYTYRSPSDRRPDTDKGILSKQFLGKQIKIINHDGYYAQVEAIDESGSQLFTWVPCDRLFDQKGRSALQLISAGILTQEDGLEGDRLVRDTAIASEAKNQPLIKSKEAA